MHVDQAMPFCRKCLLAERTLRVKAPRARGENKSSSSGPSTATPAKNTICAQSYRAVEACLEAQDCLISPPSARAAWGRLGMKLGAARVRLDGPGPGTGHSAGLDGATHAGALGEQHGEQVMLNLNDPGKKVS